MKQYTKLYESNQKTPVYQTVDGAELWPYTCATITKIKILWEDIYMRYCCIWKEEKEMDSFDRKWGFMTIRTRWVELYDNWDCKSTPVETDKEWYDMLDSREESLISQWYILV